MDGWMDGWMSSSGGQDSGSTDSADLSAGCRISVLSSTLDGCVFSMDDKDSSGW